MANLHKLDRSNRTGTDNLCARVSIYQHLDNLSRVQEQFGFRHTTITVLRALCSFLPLETREGGNARTIVWPSNEVLSERANGMPERTLRRHLQKLVEAGFITRKSSANGKRFAMRMRGVAVVAFGFDLLPLLERGAELCHLASEQAAEDDQIAILRAHIRTAIVYDELDENEIELARKALRGRVTVKVLQEVLEALKKNEPVKMAATDSENGRHIQNTNIESESVKMGGQYLQKSEDSDMPSLAECIDSVKGCLSFSAEPIRDWVDLRKLADNLGPMIGINAGLYRQALRYMGPQKASLAALCVIEMQGKLRAPAAYFNTLVDRAKVSRFSMKGLLLMAARGGPNEKFAPVN